MTAKMTTQAKRIIDTRLKTNLNGKLDCNFFCHIKIGADSGVPEYVAENSVFRFTTEDNSHDPVHAKLIDSVRQPLENISTAFTMLSHGMERESFIVKTLTEVKNTSLSTEMVTYFYRKIQ